MLNDKDTQDLIRFLTLMTEINTGIEGRKNLNRMEYLQMKAYEVALRALTTPIVARDVSEEDIEKALNEVSPYFLTNTGARDASDDNLLGEVKMTMPTTDPDLCNHIWWWNPATMKHICSKCHVKQDAITGQAPHCLHKWECNGYVDICSVCSATLTVNMDERGDI